MVNLKREKNRSLFLLVVISLVLSSLSSFVLADTCNNKVALLGDSITVGWGPKFIQSCGNQPVNFAKGGTETDWMLSKLQSDILNKGYTHLIITGGTNDVTNGKSVAEITLNLEQIYLLAKNNGIKVIAGTIPPYNRQSKISNNNKVKEVNNWIRLQTVSGKVDGVIDFYNLLVSQEPCMNSNYASSCNNVHPKSAGYQAMSNKVFSEIFGGQVTAVPPSVASLGATIPSGAVACTSSNHEIIRSNNPRQEIVNGWSAAINKESIGGKSWIGKLQSNGPNDNNNRVDTGRETIIFVPCTTDFNKKVEMMYFFHGLTGFSYFEEKDKSYNDMNLRVAPQAKKMSDAGRNFVIVFPEMPWSAGTATRSSQRTIWEDGDSNLVQLHQDVINILKQSFNPSVDVGYVSMVGHSAGGSALRYAASRPSSSNNALKQIGVDKITFSDSDYGWGFGSNTPWEEQPSALIVYNNYLQYNPNAEMNLLVQDPSKSGAHRPTQFAILTVKKLGSSDPQVASWTAEDVKWDTSNKESSSTPGAVPGQIFKVPGHPNINYVPLNIAHKDIGKMSLTWTSSGTSVALASNSIQRGQVSAKYSGGQTLAQNSGQTSPVSRNLPKRQEEIDEVWVKIGPSVTGNNLIYNPDNGNWEDFTNTYYTFSSVSGGTISQQQPSQQLTGQCFPLTSQSYVKSLDDWGDNRDGDTRCHVGLDLITKAPGEVVALEGGIVTAVKHFYECSDGWGINGQGAKEVMAIYVYNQNTGRTINYGEIDFDKVYVKQGQTIITGQKIGVASYCGMLHLELYSGNRNENIKWVPASSHNANLKCTDDSMSTKDQAIMNPTTLVTQLNDKFCSSGNFGGANVMNNLPNNPSNNIPTNFQVTSQFCNNIQQVPQSQYMRKNYLASGSLNEFNKFRTLNYGYFNSPDQNLNPTNAKDNVITTTFMGINLQFNKRVLPVLKCVELELSNGACNSCISNAKYPNECQTAWKEYPYTPSKISSLRTTNSYRGSEISNHVFGIAIDFDPQATGNTGNTCCGCVGNWKEHQFCKDSSLEPYQQMVMPSCWIDVFEKYGFYWLGNDKLEDTMHFEFLGNPKIVENQMMNLG